MTIGSILGKLNKKYKEYQADSEKRAERKLEKLRTQTAKEKVRAGIAKERSGVQRELTEAKTAVLKAEVARKKAQKELSDISPGLSGLLGRFAKPKKVVKRRVIRRRKSVVRKRAKRKTTGKSFRISFD